MLDGVRLTSPYFGGYDWSLLPTAGLERIEIARGPFSALWGADAIGGAVNVVPARAGNGLSTMLLAEAGEDDWQRLEGSLAWSDGELDLLVSGLDREARGELANSDLSARQVLVDAGWSWAPGSRVAILAQDLETELGIPFSDPLNLTPNRRQAADQQLVAIPLRLRASDRWSIEAVASRVERDLEFRDPDDPFGYTASDTSARTDQARLSSRHELGSHTVTWGGEWRSDEVDDSSSYGTNLDGQTSDVTSAFVQDVWQPTGSLQVITGLRWDEADEWGSETSPRLAIGWRPAHDLELRIGYGQAFRQPSVGELYFPYSGNPELEAETSESFELGAGWQSGTWHWQLNLFSTEIENLIDFDYATYAFANTSQAETRGVELAVEMPITARLGSSIQATWLETEDEIGLQLLRRPEWSGAWTLRGSLGPRLRGDLTLIWVGARDDVDAVSYERTRLDSHLTGNLAVGYEVLQGLELTLRVQNLADERYEEIAGYPAPGRRLSGGLRWRL
jgi:vitamin B12 transporter